MSTAWTTRAQCLCLGGSDTCLGLPVVSPWVILEILHLFAFLLHSGFARLCGCQPVGKVGMQEHLSPGVCCHLVVSLSPVFLSWKGQKPAASSHLSPTIHHYRPSCVTPQPALSSTKQPFDSPLHHLKFLNLAHPCCASWMFSEPGAAESCGSGICMGPQQYFLSWPFLEMIHYSSAIPLLGAGAWSEPIIAHAEPGLRCVHFTFIKQKVSNSTPLLAPVLSSFRNPSQLRS